MSNKFEPYYKKHSAAEFSAWEYKKHTKVAEEELVSTTREDEEEQLKENERVQQEAIKKGYEQGLLQAQVEIDAKKQELIDWIKLIQKPIQLIDDKLIQELIQTLIWLSTHCIGVELSVNPDKLRQLFKKIKDELPSLQGDKVFAMHPDDVSWIKRELGISEIPNLQDILTVDPSLSRGDFYLKSEHSELDARIQTRLVTLFAKYINKDNLISPIKIQD